VVLAVKGLGFLEKVLLAYFFGTGIEMDAYLVAYVLPFGAYVVLREVVKASYLPTFLRTCRASAADGWKLFSVLGTILLILLGAATALGILVAEPLISLTAPGFTGAQHDLAVRLTRLVMPALLFLGLSTLTTATLNAQKRFTLPAVGDLSFRSGPLVLLLIAGSIPAMAIGVVLGALGKLAIEMLGLRRYLHRVRLALNLSFPPIRTVGRLALPLMAGFTLSILVGNLVENAFASTVGVGGVSALSYSRKIVETLAAILPYTLGLVLLPFSAEMAARRDDQAQALLLTRSVRGLTLIFLPVTVGLMVLREPFIQILFERGAFTAASTELTAGPLFFYAWALLPFALEVVVVQFFFARQDTLTPVVTDVAAFTLNVALIPLLMPMLGLGGIALASAVARALKVLALLILFQRRVPAFRFSSLGPFALKMVLSSLVAAGALLALQWLSPSLVDLQGFIPLAAYLAVGGVLGGGTFLIAAYLLRVDELRDLLHRGRGLLQSAIPKAKDHEKGESDST
jgi:murein biosynthesis integral membrane protein MurJ